MVGYTAKDLDTWATVVARSIRAAGGRSGDMLHNAYGYGLFTGGLGAHADAEKLGCTVVPVSGGMTQRQVRPIQDFGPRIICVTPSYAIGDEMRRRLCELVKSSIGVSIGVAVVAPGGAERSVGKLRRIVDERPKR